MTYPLKEDFKDLRDALRGVDNRTFTDIYNAILELKLKRRKTLNLRTKIYPKVILDLGAAGSWDDERVGDPDVIKVGNKWYMYYHGYDGSNMRIGLATSTDLVSWSKYAGNPVLDLGAAGEWDELHVHKPDVVYNPDDGKYYMFYTGVNSEWYYAIGLATSNDGITWTKYINNPIITDPEGTSHGIEAATVFNYPKDGKWYMFAYNGNAKNLIFESEDLINWTFTGAELSSNVFGIYSAEAIYDSELDKVLVFVNTFYPKPTGVSEPERTGRIGVYIADKPTGPFKFLGHVVELPAKNTRDKIHTLMKANIHAPAVVKVDNLYYLYFNALETISPVTSRIFLAIVGAGPDYEHCIGVTTGIDTDPYFIPILELAPGSKIRIKSAMIYTTPASSGTPSQIYVYQGKGTAGEDNVVWWTTNSLLKAEGDIPVTGDREIGITIRGGSSTNVIDIAWSLIVEKLPEVEELDVES